MFVAFFLEQWVAAFSAQVLESRSAVRWFLCWQCRSVFVLTEAESRPDAIHMEAGGDSLSTCGIEASAVD